MAGDEIQPQARPLHTIDKYGPKFASKAEKLEDLAAGLADGKSEDNAVGGFDSTPIPHAPPGYTLKFTFHHAVNLPVADFGSLSADPYLVDLPKRHKQDPDLTFRTPTVQRDRNPEWNKEWIVANVPASGFELKCRLYDEDPADHDDRLGVVTIEADSLQQDWPGIKEQSFKVKKRKASKRVYFFREVHALASPQAREAYVVVSVTNLGQTPGDDGGHMYTIGPNYWFKHFSPLFGIIAGTKDEVQNEDGNKGLSRYK